MQDNREHVFKIDLGCNEKIQAYKKRSIQLFGGYSRTEVLKIVYEYLGIKSQFWLGETYGYDPDWVTEDDELEDECE